MTKFNYMEPEFKVVKAMSEDVIATSLDQEDKTWEAGAGSGGSSGGGTEIGGGLLGL